MIRNGTQMGIFIVIAILSKYLRIVLRSIGPLFILIYYIIPSFDFDFNEPDLLNLFEMFGVLLSIFITMNMSHSWISSSFVFTVAYVASVMIRVQRGFHSPEVL
jgi:hypothetical protein